MKAQQKSGATRTEKPPPAGVADEGPAPETADGGKGDATAPRDDGPTVYDAEARQRIKVQVPFEGELFDVALVAEPARDAVLLAYARKCETANAGQDDEDDPRGAPQLAALSAAVGWLFDTLMADIEGVGEEGEEKPADWRDIFSGAEKAEVIDRAIFAAEVVEPARVKKRRPAWGPGLRSVTTRLRVPFDGRTVEVSHTLRKADARRLGEFTALYGRTFATLTTRGVDANLADYAAGYDALHVSHTGYKGGVPLHHKAVAYIAHMTGQRAAVRKN